MTKKNFEVREPLKNLFREHNLAVSKAFEDELVKMIGDYIGEAYLLGLDVQSTLKTAKEG